MSEKILPLHDNIIFQFVDQVRDGKFLETRSDGLVADMGNDYYRYGALSRCIIVKSVGDGVSGVEIGKEYVVENLKWTKSFVLNGENCWMTRTPFILGMVQR